MKLSETRVKSPSQMDTSSHPVILGYDALNHRNRKCQTLDRKETVYYTIGRQLLSSQDDGCYHLSHKHKVTTTEFMTSRQELSLSLLFFYSIFFTQDMKMMFVML